MKREEPRPLETDVAPPKPPRREPPRDRASAWSVLRGLTLGLVIAGTIASCVVNRLMGPRLTGTCDGACAHYAQCKSGEAEADHRRCQSECPEVFSDRDSLMAFESLSCPNAIEFVDGKSPKAATRK